jgi:hypothetical protein
MCKCTPGLKTPFCGKNGCFDPFFNTNIPNPATFQGGYAERKPHKCPVCDGTGKNPNVTTSYGGTSHFIEKCLACNGACVLWG